MMDAGMVGARAMSRQSRIVEGICPPEHVLPNYTPAARGTGSRNVTASVESEDLRLGRPGNDPRQSRDECCEQDGGEPEPR
jgi:hypothetical protein